MAEISGGVIYLLENRSTLGPRHAYLLTHLLINYFNKIVLSEVMARDFV